MVDLTVPSGLDLIAGYFLLCGQSCLGVRGRDARASPARGRPVCLITTER